MPMVRPNRVKASITDSKREDGAGGLAHDRGPDQGKVFHAAAPYAATSAFDQLALVHFQLAAGMVGRLGIVGHHHDGLLVLAVELLQQGENFIRRGAVQIAGRLVAEQEWGIGDDGAGDADALLLAAGHFARLVAGAVLEAHNLQRDLDAALAFGSWRGW